MNHTPMEERVIVKFVNAEDGTTKKVLISGCTSGVEILELALKKFGKWHTGSLTSFGSDSDDNDRLELDGWGVFIHPGDEGEWCSLFSLRRSLLTIQPTVFPTRLFWTSAMATGHLNLAKSPLPCANVA